MNVIRNRKIAGLNVDRNDRTKQSLITYHLTNFSNHSDYSSVAANGCALMLIFLWLAKREEKFTRRKS